MADRSGGPPVNPKTRALFNAICILVGMAGLALFTIGYTQAQNRKICGLIVIMDNSYQERPPTTPTGRDLAAEVHRYRKEIKC
jgi:hypothetical protein